MNREHNLAIVFPHLETRECKLVEVSFVRSFFDDNKVDDRSSESWVLSAPQMRGVCVVVYLLRKQPPTSASAVTRTSSMRCARRASVSSTKTGWLIPTSTQTSDFLSTSSL